MRIEKHFEEIRAEPCPTAAALVAGLRTVFAGRPLILLMGSACHTWYTACTHPPGPARPSPARPAQQEMDIASYTPPPIWCHNLTNCPPQHIIHIHSVLRIVSSELSVFSTLDNDSNNSPIPYTLSYSSGVSHSLIHEIFSHFLSNNLGWFAYF